MDILVQIEMVSKLTIVTLEVMVGDDEVVATYVVFDMIVLISEIRLW